MLASIQDPDSIRRILLHLGVLPLQHAVADKMAGVLGDSPLADDGRPMRIEGDARTSGILLHGRPEPIDLFETLVRSRGVPVGKKEWRRAAGAASLAAALASGYKTARRPRHRRSAEEGRHP